VLDVCAEAAGSQVVVPANFNSPGQIVIGGDADAVDRALALLAERACARRSSWPSACPRTRR
jgi:[acyl-carrier-protein] S-malonyltransferase